MSTLNKPFLVQKMKITLNYPKSAAMGFFQGTQERVQNSQGKRAIRVRATRVLLFLELGQIEQANSSDPDQTADRDLHCFPAHLPLLDALPHCKAKLFYF